MFTNRFLLFYLLAAAALLLQNFHLGRDVPCLRPLSEFPEHINGWRMVSQNVLHENVISILRPTDYLSRNYEAAGGKRLNLYIGYHNGGKESGEIHSPKNCLPGSGWQKQSEMKADLAVTPENIRIVRGVYHKGDNWQLFLYWYQSLGNSYADEVTFRCARIIGSLLHRRNDAAFIRVSVPIESGESIAGATGEQFIKDVYPVICGFLPL